MIKGQSKNMAHSSHPETLGGLINTIQTLFVSLLRIWTIPIVLLLSVASGFTTFYGMSHFITPWIALVITVAIQSIIVICSLEIANIHWEANKTRYLSVWISLFIAIAASISFSYFQFYEISEHDSIQIKRLAVLKQDVNSYLNQLTAVKTKLLAKERGQMEQASKEATAAFFGTHAEVTVNKNLIGQGPVWKHYNGILQEKKQQLARLETGFANIDGQTRQVLDSLNQLGQQSEESGLYQSLSSRLNEVQISFSQLAGGMGESLPAAPVLMTYAQYKETIKPSFAMWEGFSWFAFACAAMVDFFTVLLSYRLEFTAPGPLTEREQELVFECLKQFTEFKINGNDELEMVIEKTELERARRYSDWARLFAVGFLLSRGFLRKVDAKTVEFAPNLYPLIAERMSDQIQAARAARDANPNLPTP